MAIQDAVAQATALATNNDVMMTAPPRRCEYPSKFCNNTKAEKRKGGLHKFCEFHRRKANLSQKRWQDRRREQHQQKKKQQQLQQRPAVARVISSHLSMPLVMKPVADMTLEQEQQLQHCNIHIPLQEQDKDEMGPAIMPMYSFDLSDPIDSLPDDELDALTALLFGDAPCYVPHEWPMTMHESSAVSTTVMDQEGTAIV